MKIFFSFLVINSTFYYLWYLSMGDNLSMGMIAFIAGLVNLIMINRENLV